VFQHVVVGRQLGGILPAEQAGKDVAQQVAAMRPTVGYGAKSTLKKFAPAA